MPRVIPPPQLDLDGAREQRPFNLAMEENINDIYGDEADQSSRQEDTILCVICDENRKCNLNSSCGCLITKKHK